MSDAPKTIDDAILTLVAKAGPDKSICPSQAARALSPDNWRPLLKRTRQTAIGLARQGKIVILRKGKVVDPNDFKGVYRLALPPSEPGEEA